MIAVTNLFRIPTLLRTGWATCWNPPWRGWSDR